MLRTATFLALAARVSARLRVALLSDLHIGENCLPIPYNGTDDCACVRNVARAIGYINTRLPLPDAVIITGDITSSAWPTQFEKARGLLDELIPPYYVTLGNHDVWAYEKEGGKETKGPFGDAQFGETFGDIFRASPNVSFYDPRSVHNPQHNTTSTFQNFVLTLVEPASGARLAFVAGDWSTREPAPPPNSGVPGWAERGLSDFPGGPLPWLRATLASMAAAPADARPDKLFLIQHQPVSCPFYMPDALFCFGALDKALLAAALTADWPKEAWWGVLAGHNHIFQNGTVPLENWNDFRQIEVSAAKGDGIDSDVASSFTMLEFEGADLALVTEHFYTISTGEWSSVAGL